MKSRSLTFSRSQVAEILNCTVLTIANREKSGIYPPPQRDPKNNYRFYSIPDVFNLQEISLGQIYYGPLLAALWDKGFKDPVECEEILKKARSTYGS
jgi:hypothetical protein